MRATIGGRRAVFAFDGNPDGRLDGQIDYINMYDDPLINANPTGGTFWATNNANPSTPHGEVAAGGQAWVMLDYGNTALGNVTFDRIHLYARNSNEVLAYRIETSNNGTSWTSAAHSTTPLMRVEHEGRDQPTVHQLAHAVTARYVRFVILNSQSTGMYGIRGLELYAPTLPDAAVRGVASNVNYAPRAGDLAFGATAAGSASIPRAISGGDVNAANGRHVHHAFTDDYENFWQLLSGVPNENKWLAIDYSVTSARAITFNRIIVQGRQDARPTNYIIEIQRPNSSGWTPIFIEGAGGVNVPNGIASAHNRGSEITFAEPITAAQIRIRVLASTGAANNVQISRFAIYQTNTIFGDLNSDGYVNSTDVTLLRRLLLAATPADRAEFIAQQFANGLNMTNARIRGTADINAADVTQLRRHVAARDRATVVLGQ